MFIFGSAHSPRHEGKKIQKIKIAHSQGSDLGETNKSSEKNTSSNETFH
jgi:hypothetical protein